MLVAFENALVLRLDAFDGGAWPNMTITTTTARPHWAMPGFYSGRVVASWPRCATPAASSSRSLTRVPLRVPSGEIATVNTTSEGHASNVTPAKPLPRQERHGSPDTG
jgi:hypothetical protein